jgi:hypothetical protein
MRFLAREPKLPVRQSVALAKSTTPRYFKAVATRGVPEFGRIGK